jgi:hypothetical protein
MTNHRSKQKGKEMSRRNIGRAHVAPQLKVDVTQEIIDRSVPKDSSHCMIADAIAAAYPRASFISVDLATIRFTDVEAGFRYVYLTPRHAQAALLDFDQGVKPAPFRFHVSAAQIVASGVGKRNHAAKLEKLRPNSEASHGATLEKLSSADPETGKVKKPGGEGVGVRVGGQTPPVGPLAQSHVRASGRSTNKVGRRREFGLRAIIR